MSGRLTTSYLQLYIYQLISDYTVLNTEGKNMKSGTKLKRPYYLWMDFKIKSFCERFT